MSTQSERGARRMPVKVRAAIVYGEHQQAGHLSDLSESGCQVRFETDLDEAPPNGAAVTLVLPGVGDLPAELIGTSTQSARLRFHALPAETTTRLTTFLADLKATTFDTYEDWH